MGQGRGILCRGLEYGKSVDQKDRATPEHVVSESAGPSECCGQGGELTEGLSARDASVPC